MTKTKAHLITSACFMGIAMVVWGATVYPLIALSLVGFGIVAIFYFIVYSGLRNQGGRRAI